MHHIPNAYCYRCPFGLTYPSCDLKCAKDVEEAIQTTTSQGRIAAFLAEPIQGVGGFITPPKEYFKEIVGIVRKYGGLVHLLMKCKRPGVGPAARCLALNIGVSNPIS